MAMTDDTNLSIETLRERLQAAEEEFRSVKEQEEFFRAKAEEARTLRQQLVGKATALRELLNELAPPPQIAAAPDPTDT